MFSFQVVRQSESDQVTVIGAGVTLHEALAAADILASEGRPTLPSIGQICPLLLQIIFSGFAS